MKTVMIHGINQTDQNAQELLDQWNQSLDGIIPVEDTSMAFWGDLSVANSKSARVDTIVATLADDALRELYKDFTDNHWLGDCYNYFYKPLMREQIRERLIAKLTPLQHEEEITLIAHSLGTVIAYDVLSDTVFPNKINLVTIGSPLGINEIIAELHKVRNTLKLKVPLCVEKWSNISDPHDPVALIHHLSPIFSSTIRDILVPNPNGIGLGFAFHAITGYLRTNEVRHAVLGN